MFGDLLKKIFVKKEQNTQAPETYEEKKKRELKERYPEYYESIFSKYNYRDISYYNDFIYAEIMEIKMQRTNGT